MWAGKMGDETRRLKRKFEESALARFPMRDGRVRLFRKPFAKKIPTHIEIRNSVSAFEKRYRSTFITLR